MTSKEIRSTVIAMMDKFPNQQELEVSLKKTEGKWIASFKAPQVRFAMQSRSYLQAEKDLYQEIYAMSPEWFYSELLWRRKAEYSDVVEMLSVFGWEDKYLLSITDKKRYPLECRMKIRFYSVPLNQDVSFQGRGNSYDDAMAEAVEKFISCRGNWLNLMDSDDRSSLSRLNLPSFRFI